MIEFSFYYLIAISTSCMTSKTIGGNKQQSGNDAAKELLEEYIDILTTRKELQKR